MNKNDERFKVKNFILCPFHLINSDCIYKIDVHKLCKRDFALAIDWLTVLGNWME
jgi:hypothetical protein